MKHFLNLNTRSIKDQEWFSHLTDCFCNLDVHLGAWQAVIIRERKEDIYFRRLWSHSLLCVSTARYSASSCIKSTAAAEELPTTAATSSMSNQWSNTRLDAFLQHLPRKRVLSKLCFSQVQVTDVQQRSSKVWLKGSRYAITRKREPWAAGTCEDNLSAPVRLQILFSCWTGFCSSEGYDLFRTTFCCCRLATVSSCC